MEEIALKKLKQQRTKFGLTLEQVERETLVRSNVIFALEENDIELLPAPYINSFVKTLNNFYDKLDNNSSRVQEIKSKNPPTPEKSKSKKNADERQNVSDESKFANARLDDSKLDDNFRKQPNKKIVIQETEFETFRNSKPKSVDNINNSKSTSSEKSTSNEISDNANINANINNINDANINNDNIDNSKSTSGESSDNINNSDSSNSDNSSNSYDNINNNDNSDTTSEVKNEFSQSPVSKSDNQNEENSQNEKKSEQSKSENIKTKNVPETEGSFIVNKIIPSKTDENSGTNKSKTNKNDAKIDSESEQMKESIPKTQFRKKDFKHKTRSKVRDVFIYLVLGLFFVSILFFVFLYDENNFNLQHIANFFTGADTTSEVKNESASNSTSDTILQIKDDKLIAHFAPPRDSLILEARCKDTAWVKVEMDGKKVDELLMLPNMKNRWSAIEKIVLSTSNAGNISFYLNDTLLPRLGTRGSLVRSVVITHSGLTNFAPLKNNSEAVSVSNLAASQSSAASADSIRGSSKKKRQHQQKEKKDSVQPNKPILDFSKPTRTKPPILE